MSCTRTTYDDGRPRLEPLEGRLLLSAAGEQALALPPDAMVSPALEAESQGGAANDEIASAELLSFSYLLPRVGSVDGYGPQQAAVVGTADGVGGEPYSQSMLVFGIIAYPSSYRFDFTEAVPPAGDGLLTISVNADLWGTSNYLTLEAEGIHLGDLFVEGGWTGYTVHTEVTVPQEQLAMLAADGVISLTFTPSPDVMSIGTGFIGAGVSYGGGGGAGTGDFYRFDLADGETASVAASAVADGEVGLELYDAEGTLLATAEAGADGTAGIAHFAPAASGAYYARVGGTGEYVLRVNRNATLDLESNNDMATAQAVQGPRLDGRQWVVGGIAADADVYVVMAGSRGSLRLSAYAPAARGVPNALRPVVSVYDAGGVLVAGGEGASVRYCVPRGGDEVYYVQVAGADGTTGGYALSVKYQPNKGNGTPKKPAPPKGPPPDVPRGRGAPARGKPAGSRSAAPRGRGRSVKTVIGGARRSGAKGGRRWLVGLLLPLEA